MIFHEKLISQQSLVEYFSDGIYRESAALSPPLSDEVIHYVTRLLIHFSHSNRLFIAEENTRMLPTLALLYEQAYAADNDRQRHASLRQLGDSALFLGALFHPCFLRKGMDKDYFIGMGSGAYGSLGAGRAGHVDDASLFSELAEKFPTLLQIIANVCAVEFGYNAQDIFSLLERWQRSKDDTLRKQLYSVGIVPFEFKSRH